jgi:hypothetical protein
MSSLIDIGIELKKCPKPPISLIAIDSVFEESPNFFEKYRETIRERIHNYIDPNLEYNLDIEKQITHEIEKHNTNTTNILPQQNENKMLIYNDNEVFNIPSIIKLSNSNDYALIGMSKIDSFLSSVLYVLDTNFRLESKNQRKNTIKQNKIDMAVKVGDYFKRQSELKKYKTDRIDIKTKLINDNDVRMFS